MASDELIWNILNKQFCSYKKTAIDQRLCAHPMNVKGQCKMIYCPLANSQYATVIERKGRCYLCLKSPERTHLPNRQWDFVLLDKNYEKAIKQIEKMLQFWREETIENCKLKFTYHMKALRRMRKLRRTNREKLHTVKKKLERRLRSREIKALRAAKIENVVEQKLLEKLKRGEYGKLYNFKEEKEEEKEEELEEEYDIPEFIENDESDVELSDLSDVDEEAIEDILYELESEALSDVESVSSFSSDTKKKRGKKRHLEIEYDDDERVVNTK